MSLDITPLNIQGGDTLKATIIGDGTIGDGKNVPATINEIISKAGSGGGEGGISEIKTTDDPPILLINEGKGPTTTLNFDASKVPLILHRHSGMLVELSQVAWGTYYHGATGTFKKEEDPCIDLIEVSNAGQWGKYGPMCFTVNTQIPEPPQKSDEESVLIYADTSANAGAGSDITPTAAMVHVMTFQNGLKVSYETSAEKEYRLSKYKYYMEDSLFIAQRTDMFIPDRKDIIISKNEQSFDLRQYIPKLYYSHALVDPNALRQVHEVSIDDCITTTYYPNEPGIYKIDIRYIGKFNTFINKENIYPASIYLKVVE